MNDTKGEYEVKFYCRPFGLDLKYNEFNDDICVSRSAWKDIKISSVLCKVNGKTLDECLMNDDQDEDDHDVDDDGNKFKSTIKYLQTCSLPTTMTLKYHENKSYSSLIAPFVELPQKSFYDMNNDEFIAYLQTNWINQTYIYAQYNTNPVFKQKYSSFLSLIEILQQNIVNFEHIADKLRNVGELNGENLSKYEINQDVISGYIKSCIVMHSETSAKPLSLNERIKNEMSEILQTLGETNLEKIAAPFLFKRILGQLLFEELIHFTEIKTKTKINTAYLYNNKQRIFDRLCELIPNLKNITQVRVIGIMKQYFKNDYSFMDADGDNDKQSEYWFIFTVLNDILLFPMNHSTEGSVINESIPLQQYLDNPRKYRHIFSVNDVSTLPHTMHQMPNRKNTDENENITIQYLERNKTQNQINYSLRDRLKYFKSDVLHIETLAKYLCDRLKCNQTHETQHIKRFLECLVLSDMTESHIQHVNVPDFHIDVNESNVGDIDVYVNHLALWIYNIVEILRSDCNKEHDLFNYLTNQRPKDLIKNDVDKIRRMDRNELINYISNKVSEIANDKENNNELANTLRKVGNQDALLLTLNKLGLDNEALTNLSITELWDAFIKMHAFEDQSEVGQIVNWLYAVMHDVQRIKTPIFDTMMQQRTSLKHSLLDPEEDKDEDEDEDMDEMFSKFMDLKKSVDHKLQKEDHPLWHQYDDEFEQEFVRKFLNDKGFADHSEKFQSMSCLSKLKNRQLRKMELCAKHRKNLMKKVNKWNELQNIIKYGEKPYYRSNGYDRTSIPSYNQCYGEIEPNKSRDFDPQTDQTKTTKMFYVPFVNYADLHRLVQQRNFVPSEPLKSIQDDSSN